MKINLYSTGQFPLFSDKPEKLSLWRGFLFFGILLLCLSLNAVSQITFVSVKTGVAAQGPGTLTINAPAGIQNSDVLIAHFSIYCGSKDSVVAPSGWTNIRLIFPTGGLVTTQYCYKVAGASEPLSYAFTLNSGVLEVVGGILAYRGVSNCQPIDIENGTSTSSAGNTISTPSVTANNANEMIIALFDRDQIFSCPVWTTPANMTKRDSACSTSGHAVGLMSADLIQASAGSTGTFSTSYTGTSSRMTAEIIALRPASLDPPAAFQSATTTQNNTGDVAVNSANNQIIGVQVSISGCGSTLNVSSLTFNTTGSTNASTDITNAKVWYTGTSNTFSTATQFGSTIISPNGTFIITGSQAIPSGTYYFWLSYDIASGATLTDIVDAQCTTITVAGLDQTPTVTNPSGSRTIQSIAFVSSSSTATSTTSITINTPALITANDFLIAHFSLYYNNGSNVDSITPPSGWTKIRLIQDPTTNAEYFYRVAGSSEPSSYTFIRSGTGEMSGAITNYRGVSVCYPIDVENGTNSGASSVISITTPSLTTNGANEMIVALFGKDIGGSSCPAFTSTGLTQQYAVCSTTYESVVGGNAIQSAPGSAGPFTASYTGTAAKMTAEIIALKPSINDVPMVFQSSTTTQQNTTPVSRNTTNNQVIGVQIVTTGCSTPLGASSFTFNTSGSTNPTVDITNAKVWYTGTSSSFVTGTQFGSTVASPNGTFSITGSQLLAGGINYFWLSYDIPSAAVTGDVIDAQCSSVTVGSAQTPVVIDPSGSRAVFPISFVNRTSNSASGTTTIAINAPAGIQANDFLMAHFGTVNQNNADSILTLSGWIKIGNTVRKTSPFYSKYINSDYFYKIAGASEPGSYTFTRATSNGSEQIGEIMAYRGVSPCYPIDIVGGIIDSVNSIGTPSITTTIANEMLVALYGRDYNGLSTCFSLNTPAGMTLRYSDCSTSFKMGVMGADLMQASAGATGAFSASYIGTALKMTAEIIALKPASSDAPMAFQSATTTQADTTPVGKSYVNNAIIGIQVVTSGCTSAINVTNFNFNTSGSTNPVIDFTNAKVWYTGTSSTFATGTQFGSTIASPNGTFSITGSQSLAGGTNYFWLTYDIPSSAVIGDLVDAQCSSVTVGSAQTPTVTNPTGSRSVFPIYFVNRTTGTAASSATVTINAPAGIQANDFLIAQFNTLNQSTADSIKVLSGWTKIGNTVRASPYTIYINSDYFYKIAGTSEPASYTFTRGGASVNSIVGEIVAYRGVSLCNSIDVQSGTISAGSVNSVATPSVTTTNANEMIVTLVGRDYNSTFTCGSLTTPSGMTQRYSDCGASYFQGIMGAELMQTSAGATGSFTTFFGGTACKMTAEILALRPILTVAAITAVGGATSLCKDSTLQLSDGTIGGVWSSVPGTGQATVNSSGLVTGLAAGTDTIKYAYTSGGCTTTVSYLINVNSCNFTYNFKFFIQGYYIGGGKMSTLLKLLNLSASTTAVDTVIIELHNSSNPYALVRADAGILQSNGTISFSYPAALLGNSYFFVIRHRNSLETWSNGAQSMTVNGLYDFTIGSTQAYGNNIVSLGDGNWGIYSGDITKDGNINGFDKASLQNLLSSFLIGTYNVDDITGDGMVDEDDYRIMQNIVPLAVTVQHP